MDKAYQPIDAVKRIKLRCGNCDTEFSLNVNALRHRTENEFNCPVCEKSLTDYFHDALDIAITFNDSYSKLLNFKKRTGITFDMN